MKVSGKDRDRPQADASSSPVPRSTARQRSEDELRRARDHAEEAVEQQIATARILHAMSNSPTDAQPVFDAIATSALKLCRASSANVLTFDGELVRVAAIEAVDSRGADAIRSLYPRKPGREFAATRAIITRRVVAIHDVLIDPEFGAKEAALAAGFRSILAVPLLRDGGVVGAIAVGRAESGAFPDKQLALLQTFADQAVIAIENVRLFHELETRNRELSETIDQQSATSEILRTISSSPTNIQPVFDAIVRSGLKLFADAAISIALPDAGMIDAVAVAEDDAGARERWLDRFPFPLTREYMHGVAILDRTVVDVPDVRAAPARFATGAGRFLVSGYRAITIVPLMRGAEAIGALSVVRRAPGPLSDKQRAVLSTFAEQAVIAIENVRLFNETREALEQQTASAEVLRAISSSIGDTAPVFDKIVESCGRLFAGRIVGLNLVDDDGVLRIGAYHGAGREGLEKIYPLPLDRTSASAMAIMDRRIVHYADVHHDADAPAATKIGCSAIGIKSVIFAPVLWEGRGVGAIFVGRDHVSSFSEKEIALLKTFADQAAIGLENARLFRELQTRNREVSEALNHQTASAEVLRVISGSIGQTAPIFEKIVDSCSRLFAGRMVGLNLVQPDDTLRLAAYQGPDRDELEKLYPLPLKPTSGSAIAILERRIVHYADTERADVPQTARAASRIAGMKSIIFAPLMREGRGIGVIFVARDFTGPFSDKEIALLRTFADQAAIGIENARLFRELERRNQALSEALEQQTATSEILRVISRSPTDVQPVFDSIAASAKALCNARSANVLMFDGRMLHLAARAMSQPGPTEAVRKVFPRPAGRDTVAGRAVLTRCVATIPDALADPDYGAREAAMASGSRSFLAVPLLREEIPIGAIAVGRPEVGPIPEQQVALLRTFADQAVIAIENVRLFNELREKSEQLELASRHKSEFLANMSHELRTPLNAIIGFTRIVMRRSRDVLESKQYENLEKILQSGQNLLALINSILDLAKVEAGRVEVNASDVELPALLEHCVRTVEPLINSEAVALVRDFDGPPPAMFVDDEKLRQIVINLLSNAAKFTSRGSIRVSSTAAGNDVQIAVTDTGTGISPEKIELIFEEFEQADASSTRVHGGTGLGLTIARRLARLMGGDIRAESTPGVGSTFTLSLPLRYRGDA